MLTHEQLTAKMRALAAHQQELVRQRDQLAKQLNAVQTELVRADAQHRLVVDMLQASARSAEFAERTRETQAAIAPPNGSGA